MSKVIINGITVFSSQDHQPTKAPAQATATPSWDTHRMVNGNWVPKNGTISPTQAPSARPIGFTVAQSPTKAEMVVVRGVTSDVTIDGTAVYSSRKAVLRAIEIAAGKTLLAGTNASAIEAIRRGRLGGRKDNLQELHQLLKDYSA